MERRWQRRRAGGGLGRARGHKGNRTGESNGLICRTMRPAVVELYIKLSLIFSGVRVWLVVGLCIISLPCPIQLELLVGIVFRSALIGSALFRFMRERKLYQT